MSLRVWLPLTKNLRNQGLSDIVVTNNGATYSTTGGKLGGYYGFNATSQFINLSNYMTTFKTFTNYSISVWVYIENKANDHSAPILSSGNWNHATGQLVFGFCDWSTDHYTRLLVPNISGWSNGINYNFMVNTWYHIAIIYNGLKTLAYVNGEKIGEYSGGGIATTSETDNLYIGRATYYSGFNLQGKLNDVRIYDHALSPMEVKQISQGLVLHYPLDNNGWGQENIFKKTREVFDNNGSRLSSTTINNGLIIDSNAPNGKYRSWNVVAENNVNRGIYYTYTNSNIVLEDLTANEVYTLSFWSRCSKTKNLIIPSLVESQTVQKVDGGDVPSSGNIVVSNRWERHSVTFKWISTSKITTCFYLRSLDETVTLDIASPKLEKGSITTPWCPNSSDELATTMGLNSTTEYDCSGFCNNGTRTGTFTWTSNTPKYAVSQVFNGTDNAIQTPSLPTMITDKNYTVACWTYKTVIGTKNYQTIYGGPGGFELEARSSSSTSPLYRIHNWGGGTTAYNFGEWTHFCFVHTDLNSKLYVNGELKITGTSVNIPSGNYFIGAWNTATQQNFDGLMSDFRIYATALSASDIKSLYQNSAYIDSSGNVYGAVHEEV